MNDNIYDINNTPQPPKNQGLGLAIAALILGIISIPFSLFLIGGLFGFTGLILAIIHISQKYTTRAMAVWGLSLSVFGILLSILFSIYVVYCFRTMRDTMANLSEQTYDEWLDKAAPELAVEDIDGNTIQLSQFKGKRVIVDFWATWCPPCKKEIPHFVKLLNLHGKDDLIIVGVSSETKEKISKFAKQHNINYLLTVSNEKLPAPYGDITSIPTTFFIDKDGIIRYILQGYHDFEAIESRTMALNLPIDPNIKTELVH